MRRRNPQARALREPCYRQKVKPSKRTYTRKTKHPQKER